MSMLRLLPSLTLLAAISVFSGCESQVIIPTSPRSPAKAEAVEIYQIKPKKYELLGTVVLPITPEMKWDERGDSTVGFEALKARVAEMGANGVLLAINTTDYDLLVGVGYKGKFYQVPTRREPRTVVVQAIYMLEK